MVDVNTLRLVVCGLLALAIWLLSADLVLRWGKGLIDARSGSIGAGMVIALLPVCYSGWYASANDYPYNPAVVFAVACDLVLVIILGYWVARDVWHFWGPRSRAS